MPAVGTEVYVVLGQCRVAATTLVRSLIWPCNSFVLSHYTSSFSVSPSLVSEFVRRRLSLCSSYLGVSAKVSTAQLTTWYTFLAITVVHLGSFVEVALVMTIGAALRSVS
jgi:hypothetical protein